MGSFATQTVACGASMVIPPNSNRTVQRAYDANPYADRNKIERLFGQLKHYRRMAPSTRSLAAAPA